MNKTAKHKLMELAVYQSRNNYTNVYLKLQSQNVFVSKVAALTIDNYFKCKPQMDLSSNQTFKLQVWNYQPHRLIRQWRWEGKQMAQMKQKHIFNDDLWTVYFCKDIVQQSKENQKKQANKQIQSNKHIQNHKNIQNYKQNINSKPQNPQKSKNQTAKISKSRKAQKDSIKKVLKSTIDYLMKHQDKSMDREGEIMRAKTGKCTPASEKILHVKNHSTIFNEYGLNVTQLNQKYISKQASKEKLMIKAASKRKGSKIR